MRKPTTTSFAILGQIAIRPRSSYELTQQMRRNTRYFWPRAESKIYAELKRLVSDGLLIEKRDYVGLRGTSRYTIAAAGRAVLDAWLADPARPGFTLEYEQVLRVFLAKLSTPARLLAAIDGIRADAEEVLSVGKVVGAEYLAGTADFQDEVHIRALIFDLLSTISLALIAWSDRAHAEVARWSDLSPTDKEEHAKHRIRETIATFPKTIEPSPTVARHAHHA